MAEETTERVRFHVTAERMADVELGEILDIQDNPNDLRLVTTFLSRFIVGPDGAYLAEEAARTAIRKVKIGQLKSTFEAVMGDLKESAVPNG